MPTATPRSCRPRVADDWFATNAIVPSSPHARPVLAAGARPRSTPARAARGEPAVSLTGRPACPHPAGKQASADGIREKHRAPNAASRGGTPDLATLIHDRHQIGSGCHAVRGNRTIKKMTSVIDAIRYVSHAGSECDHEQLHVLDRCPRQLPATTPHQPRETEKPRLPGLSTKRTTAGRRARRLTRRHRSRPV